jgi:glutamate 5-kinase
MRPILVIKFGTASITHATGEPDLAVIRSIATQVAALQPAYRIILVSSGAVGAGKRFLQAYKGTTTERKAAAAIGNPVLLQMYAAAFEPQGVAIAQSLCERHHFAHRSQFLQLQETYETLWDNGLIPIANENDVVSNLELKFSDNDELATLLAVGFGASHLLISTSVGGLLDAQGQLIPRVPVVDAGVLALVRDEKSALGLGGMLSKLTYTRLATRMGISTSFFNVRTPDGIGLALRGATGTLFEAQPTRARARQRWLSSGSLIAGRLTLDAGAVAALLRRSSLLAVGIQKVKGTFGANEVIELADPRGQVIGVARTRHDAQAISANLLTQNFEVAHADDIVLL